MKVSFHFVLSQWKMFILKMNQTSLMWLIQRSWIFTTAFHHKAHQCRFFKNLLQNLELLENKMQILRHFFKRKKTISINIYIEKMKKMYYCIHNNKMYNKEFRRKFGMWANNVVKEMTLQKRTPVYEMHRVFNYYESLNGKFRNIIL